MYNGDEKTHMTSSLSLSSMLLVVKKAYISIAFTTFLFSSKHSTGNTSNETIVNALEARLVFSRTVSPFLSLSGKEEGRVTRVRPP